MSLSCSDTLKEEAQSKNHSFKQCTQPLPLSVPFISLNGKMEKKIFMFKMTRNVKKNEIAFYDLNDTDINRNLLLHFTVLVVMHF